MTPPNEPPHEPPHDPVTLALARLSAGLRVDPPADDPVTGVLTRIDRLPVPSASRPRQQLTRLEDALRRHRRAVTAVAVAVLLSLFAVSPAGAKVAEWLGLGAVKIVPVPADPSAPSASAGPADPASTDGFVEVTLDQARDRAPFPLVVPADLGPPPRVFLRPDRAVVSMVWPAGAASAPIRLDQLAGRPDYAVVKQYGEDVDFTRVGGADAFWLRRPHPLTYTDPTGAARSEPSRIAGPTLIWTDGPVTLRLEGVDTLGSALRIARSTG